MTGHIWVQDELTARDWSIVCRLTDIQSKTAETWRDLVTNGRPDYLRSNLNELEGQITALLAIVPEGPEQ